MTPDGARAIEELKAGDLVLSRDEHDDGTAAPTPCRVEEVFVREGRLMHLGVAGGQVATTPEHPFFVKDEGWVAAGDLQPGDRLATAAGDWLPLDSVNPAANWTTVYNFRVANYHTYFVAPPSCDAWVWVHNAYQAGHNANAITAAESSQILDTQRSLAKAANRQADVVTRFLRSSDSRVAKAYRQALQDNPNFASLIEGRVLDRRLNSLLKRQGLGTGVRLDQTVPNTGSRLRPDVYFPALGGRRVIFDFGGPSKTTQIQKFQEFADEIIPIVPVQRF
ncbi:MAG: polymorphic toxin-type HINT domain-containing protein [Planctomycetota bacterium]